MDDAEFTRRQKELTDVYEADAKQLCDEFLKNLGKLVGRLAEDSWRLHQEKLKEKRLD